METTTKVIDYNLAIKGVWGRNRSVKFKTVRLARKMETDPEITAAELDRLVKDALFREHVKSGAWAVDRDPVELKRSGDGIVFECFMLFSGTRVLAGTV